MRADNVMPAYTAMTKLAELESVRETVVAGVSLNVVICSVWQDKVMADAARPAVIAELDRRLEALRDLLRGMGVQI